jgi:hypothetical protein
VTKDFNDFLTKSGVQPPPPPAGRKYVIQNQVVALADQQVDDEANLH